MVQSVHKAWQVAKVILLITCVLLPYRPVFAAQPAASSDKLTRKQPNFVVIFTDDQGYADVGCFGSPDIRTPRLDTMAAQGMKFTNFYAQPICGPSRAA